MSTYDGLMRQGEQDLNTGNFALAKAMFVAAAQQVSISDEQAARATQLWAVALRLLGDFEKADKAFRIAYSYCTVIDDVLQGSILRDWAMNDYDRGNLEVARARITEAMLKHQASDDLNELGASTGVLARITGDLRDYALRDYAEADRLLHKGGNRVYRMNNMVWWMRNERYLKRWKLLPTALQLANFWQDLSEDLPRGRFYLPEADCAAHGVQRADLLHLHSTPATTKLIAASAGWARASMQKGAPLVHRLPGRAGWELRLVVQGGLRILDKVDALHGASLHTRPRIRP